MLDFRANAFVLRFSGFVVVVCFARKKSLCIRPRVYRTAAGLYR